MSALSWVGTGCGACTYMYMYMHVHVHHVDYVHLTSDYTCTCIILKCVIQVCNVHLTSVIHVHV